MGLVKNPLKKPKTRAPLKVSSSLWAKGKEAAAVPPAQKQAYYNQVMANQRAAPGWGTGGPSFEQAKGFTNYQLDQLAAGGQPPVDRGGPGGGGGRGGGGGYGGGGGGGGGLTAQAAAQGQMDYLAKLLASGQWTAPRQDAMRGSIASATAADQAAASGAYNALDQWLAQNQSNPYANVQLQNARFAPAQNAYLSSQGLTPMNDVQANPEDVGAQAAFSNVLKLLGAGQQASQQSRGAESQMARTFAGQQIGAMDNAMLAQIAAQEAQQQSALDAEKRKIMLELAALVGQGAAPPDLSAFGL
jgi:hypothetical protein